MIVMADVSKAQKNASSRLTEVQPCSCKNQYQDAIYGKGQRLFNPTAKGDGTGGIRCSVCGKER